MLVQSIDKDAPVTIASYTTSHEAYLGCAALASQGVPAVVQGDHGQYVSTSPWVQLQVARRDLESAVEILERGPLQPGDPATAPSVDPAELRQERLKRRFVVARWFLYASALGLLLGVVSSPLFVVPLALALWSETNPRPAFAAAFGLQIVVACVAIALTGLSGLAALIALVAYYWAWTGAMPDPPEELLSSLFPASRKIPIGDSWRVNRGNDEPTSYPAWFFRGIGVVALVLLIVWALRQALRIA